MAVSNQEFACGSASARLPRGLWVIAALAGMMISAAFGAYAAEAKKPDASENKTSKKEADGKPDAKENPKAEEVHGVGPVLDFPMKHNVGGGANLKEEKAWKDSGFIGTGKIRIENGVVFLDEGNDITGITWTGPLVRMNYEITLEAKRVAGEDFFCGLTFPYGKDPCSFIVGGWGGTCCGISSIDYEDAYNNSTARFITFEKDKWYKIRLRATEKRIQTWIDDKEIVDVSTESHQIGIRWEVDRSTPLGIATWRTGGAIRNVEFRVLTEVEKSLSQVKEPKEAEKTPATPTPEKKDKK